MTGRRIAWLLLLIVDVSYIAWGAGAALAPEQLTGPGGKGILPAAYEGYTGGSWAELTAAEPPTAGYIALMYRMYGIYCAIFGVLTTAIVLTAFRRAEPWAWWTLLGANTAALIAAITMDKLSNAIGPLEVTEYVGLVLVWAAMAMTAPFVEKKA